MIILLHILYIYSEYLWSCLVNRNRLADDPETDSSCTSEQSEKNNDIGSEPSKKESSCSANIKSQLNSSNVIDNLESESVTSDRQDTSSEDRFSFGDDFEEFQEAAYDYVTKKITFYPPVYIQRYVKVINILKDDRWKGEIKKVA